MALSQREAPIVPAARVQYAGPDPEAYEEISLVDIARVLYRRRIVLAIVLAASLVGGVALVFLTTPEYEARAELIPLEHETIITNWLESRQAAEFAVARTGDAVMPILFPDRWDAPSGAWRGDAPTTAEVGTALSRHVDVTGGAKVGAPITLSVTLSDPAVTRDVASAYIASLEELRPELENITRSQLFDKYYTDSGNAQEAQGRAETVAKEKSYWLTFDEPSIPQTPVKPRPVLYMALATALGIVGGIMVVFSLEWLSKYRADFTRLEPPPRS